MGGTGRNRRREGSARIELMERACGFSEAFMLASTLEDVLVLQDS